MALSLVQEYFAADVYLIDDNRGGDVAHSLAQDLSCQSLSHVVAVAAAHVDSA